MRDTLRYVLMEANELVACLETRLKVIARIGQQACAKVLSERETETING